MDILNAWRGKMEIKKERFGFFKSEAVHEYTLSNAHDFALSVITYGGIITKILMPNRLGEVQEITVNMTTLDEIIEARPFHGAIVGPVAGRISNGRYLDGDEYVELKKNENGNTLHSGTTGLDTRVWKAETKKDDSKASLILTTTLPDGEAGFPGDVKVKVTYTLNNQNEVRIHYEAETNKRTIFNPSNHVYFNLSGKYQNSVYAHDLQVNSNHYAALNEESIPTGELKKVTDTAFDLREGERLGNVIINKNEEIVDKGGLDHPFVVNPHSDKPVVRLSHVASGRVLEVETDRDAIVIYTHNHIQKPVTNNDRLLGMHCGIALETQNLPDAVNQSNFGSIWLEPDQLFSSETVFKFSFLEE